MYSQEEYINIVKNYKELTSITGFKEYYPISLDMPWANDTPIVQEIEDGKIITTLWEKLKFKDIFQTFIIPVESLHDGKFFIDYQNINKNKLEHNRISLEPKSEPILSIGFSSQREFHSSAIDMEALIKDQFFQIMPESIDDFFIKGLITQLGNNIHTQLGYIKEGEKVLEAIEKLSIDIFQSSYFNEVGYILINPATLHEITAYKSYYLMSGYQWWDNIGIKAIVSKVVPQEYMYIIPKHKKERLSFIVGISNLLGIDKNRRYCIECDYGVIDNNDFGRVKLKAK